MYDLANDPGEWTNLFEREPGRVAELKGALLDWLATADENDHIAERWEI